MVFGLVITSFSVVRCPVAFGSRGIGFFFSRHGLLERFEDIDNLLFSVFAI